MFRAQQTHTVPQSATPAAQCEPLEPRTLLAADTISILGTAAADVINISQAGTVLTVKLNGVTKTYSTVGKTKLSVAGGDGDDVLNVALSVKLNATLDGGLGKDRLHGGGGIDTFIGGADTDFVDYADSPVAVNVSLDGIANDGPTTLEGAAPASTENVQGDVENILGSRFSDRLTGNDLPNVIVGNDWGDYIYGLGGRDVLIGGGSYDHLDGGADDDLLIGSATVYDASVPSLRTLGYEWRNPANSYSTRIGRLKTGVLGVKIDKASVPYEGSGNTLTGKTGQDWFVTRWGDTLPDKSTSETSTLFSIPAQFNIQSRYVESDADAGGDIPTPNYKKAAASNFAAFQKSVTSSFVYNEPGYDPEWSGGSAIQNSSLTDTKISYVGGAGANSFDAMGYGRSYFSVTFTLFEPRAYTLKYDLTWNEDAADTGGDAAIRLTKGNTGSGTVLAGFTAGLYGSNRHLTATLTGKLQPGQYTFRIFTVARAYQMYASDVDLSASLTTVPAGT